MSSLLFLILLTFALWALVEFGFWLWKKFSLRRPQSERLFEAGIARDLAPRLNPYIERGSTLYIMGSDGSYATKRGGYFWLSQLNTWLSRGCKIHYLLCSADSASSALYRELAQRHEEQFIFYELNSNQTTKSEVSGLIRKYDIFHPVLLEIGKGRGRAMWIEHYHPKNSELAFEVEFVSPEDGRSDPRFDDYLREIQTLMKSAVPGKHVEARAPVFATT